MTEPSPSQPAGLNPFGHLSDWSLPAAAARTLSRVARTRVPILLLGSYGPAFTRVAAAVHGESQRDRLILVDLRSARDAILTGLVRAGTSPRSTIAIDGIELLDRDTQAALLRSMEREAPRLLSGSAIGLDELREALRPEFFALVTTITVRAPALAERGHALGALAERRLAELAAELDRPAPRISEDAVAALAAHAWPGDAAELEALLVRTLLSVDAPLIEARHLRWHPEACEPEGDRVPPGTGAPPSPAGGHGADSDANGSWPSRSSAEGASPFAEADRSSETEAIAVELAHQLKNPLVTVKTFVQNVSHLASDPADLARFRDLTDEAIARMDDALDELLAFTRLGPPHPIQLDVVELLREALREAWTAFAAKEISVTGPNGAALQVLGDRNHLRTALATLARHLLEAIEPRSALAIAIQPRGRITLSYRESGATTHLRGVTDLAGGSLPLALLLVRTALGRLGSDLEVNQREDHVEVALRFATG